MLEGLTGLSTRDEWDYQYLGFTNQPFIKANYPHHQGTWSWLQEADQVILAIRSLRCSLIEYHDILWDLDYSDVYWDSFLRRSHIYTQRPPEEDFVEWRDDIVLTEINWYGWFIDYWMEGGLLRDIETNRITTQEHWDMIVLPTAHTPESVSYETIIGDATVTPTYDPHCLSDVSGGCQPVQIISADRLCEQDTGPAENRKIAEVLLNKAGVEDYLISDDAWECVWNELLVEKKGFNTFIDRKQMDDRDYNFSEEMLNLMITELDRLLSKYSEDIWVASSIAQNLLEILQEHRDDLQIELEEVQSGTRRLRFNDFLGPNTRKKRAKERLEKNLYWGNIDFSANGVENYW